MSTISNSITVNIIITTAVLVISIYDVIFFSFLFSPSELQFYDFCFTDLANALVHSKCLQGLS